MRNTRKVKLNKTSEIKFNIFHKVIYRDPNLLLLLKVGSSHPEMLFSSSKKKTVSSYGEMLGKHF